VAGAVMQEVNDEAVVVNALRVAFPPKTLTDYFAAASARTLFAMSATLSERSDNPFPVVRALAPG
jgi:hypothetical protein